MVGAAGNGRSLRLRSGLNADCACYSVWNDFDIRVK